MRVKPVPPKPTRRERLLERAERRRELRACNAAALLLLAIGCTQMTGYLAGCKTLRGLGAASAASPFPKVFSAVRGYETFAADFEIVYDDGGETVRVPLTPERYALLRGPYNRRNVYGAALAYGPRLPRDLWEPVFRHAMRQDGAFHRELGLPASARNVRVEVRSRTAGHETETYTLWPCSTE